MRHMARLEGIEPPTYGLEIRCSIQLSYGRIFPKLPTFFAVFGEPVVRLFFVFTTAYTTFTELTFSL